MATLTTPLHPSQFSEVGSRRLWLASCRWHSWEVVVQSGRQKAHCWYTLTEGSDLALRLFVYAEPERGASRCGWEEPSTAVAPVLSVMEDVISS